jgi:O-antigen/teichoic acid export membrane protein
MCFVGMLYPLHALNLNMLTVQGRSDLFLRLEIIKKMIFIPMIVVGVVWGIKMMILGMLLSSIFAYFLNSYWSGKMIGYSSLKQLQDIMPSFLLAATMGAAVYAAGAILKTKPWLTLLIQVVVGGIIVFGAGEIFGMGDYQYIKGVAGEYLFSGKNRMGNNEGQ